jgi:DNA segregation ATPase FtsK/SpoIIIE, S-DNA-T family
MITSTEAASLRNRVTRRLTEFQIKIELPVHTDIYQAAGLAVMRFKPLAGAAQKVDAILGRENEMALAAGVVPRMYLDAPTNSVVAEFLLAKPPVLHMSALMDSGIAYGMTIGRDVQGNPLHVNIDNDAMPHALVVGTTGSGKTALCHSMVATIAKATPRLKLLTYDPAHPGFPWLMPFIKSNLIEAVSEPERLLVRLNQMVDLIADGRSVPGRCLIYIDELRDLIQACPAIVEPLTRIAQRGRQAGVHLLCATQNPSRKSLPPDLLKNMPARVVLAVVDRAESDMASGNMKIDAHKLPRPGAGVLVANGQTVRFIAAIPDDYKKGSDVNATQAPLDIRVSKPAPDRSAVIERRNFALPSAKVSPLGEGVMELGPARTQTIEPEPVAVMTRPADSYSLEERVRLLVEWNPEISIRAIQAALKPGGAQNGFDIVARIVDAIRAERETQ